MHAAVGRGQLFCVVRPELPRFLQVALYLFFVLRLGQAAGARMLFSVGGYDVVSSILMPVCHLQPPWMSSRW